MAEIFWVDRDGLRIDDPGNLTTPGDGRPMYFQCEAGDTHTRTLRGSGIIGPIQRPDYKPVAPEPHCPRPDGYDKGHIIAFHLNGPNLSHNIAPMVPTFNRAGNWAACERAVESAYDQRLRTGGAYATWVDVVLNYDADAKEDDELWSVPISVQYEASIVTRAGAKLLCPSPFGSTASPIHFWTGPTEAPPERGLPQYWCDNLDAIFSAAHRAWEVGGVNELRSVITMMPDVRKSSRPRQQNQISAPQVRIPPNDDSLSFHTALDFITVESFENLYFAFTGANLRKDFREKDRACRYLPFQVELIKAHNAWLQTHGTVGLRFRGPYLSEYSGDKYATLNPQGHRDRPEIDHIAEYAKGGTNFFCNARVVSRVCNASIQRSGTPAENKKRPAEDLFEKTKTAKLVKDSTPSATISGAPQQTASDDSTGGSSQVAQVQITQSGNSGNLS